VKRLFACIFLSILLSGAAYAQSDPDGDLQKQGQSQGKGHGQQGSGDRIARMQKNLGLTSEQVAQMHEIRERGGGSEEMRAVLTEEQKVIMRERRRQAKEQKQGGRSDPGRYYIQPEDGEPADPDGG
jgi:Spy/CpxP family protein refolding chaperone